MATIISRHDGFSSDAYDAWSETQRESRRGSSGHWGKVRAKASRNQMDFSGTKKDRAPGDVILTRDGMTVVIPGEWITLGGKIRKGRVKDVEALFEK